MENPKNAKSRREELDAANALKMREQLGKQISQLSDEELEAVAGGLVEGVQVLSLDISCSGGSGAAGGLTPS